MAIENIPAGNNELEPNFEYKNLGLTQIELAENLDEQNKGLMFVRNLCAECGMLFIYQNPQILNFWMKNTKSDLDIIFIDENGFIINIVANLTEGTSGPGSTAESKKPAKYVLEIQAGRSQEIGLKSGDKIDVDQLIRNGKPFEKIFPRNES